MNFRIVIREDILTRQYFDETGNVKYHQILLPQHLLQELLQSLHGTAHKHPGIRKMLQEFRQRYYYPSVAKYVKKWIEGCEQCAKDKRVPNATITPELLNLPNGERSITAEANSSDAKENEADYIITTDSPNDVNDAVHSRKERLNDDVSKRNEASKATSNGESDWSNPAVYPQNQGKS